MHSKIYNNIDNNNNLILIGLFQFQKLNDLFSLGEDAQFREVGKEHNYCDRYLVFLGLYYSCLLSSQIQG